MFTEEDHNNMLPHPLPNNLQEIQNLINDRFSKIEEINKEILIRTSERRGIQNEVRILQNAGKSLLKIAPRKKKEEINS